MLKGKKIVLGITGSIAAYKACYIIRGLVKRGADVTLVSGPTSIPKPMFVNVLPVTTAKEMFEAVRRESEDADIVCKAAAVADYRPKYVNDQKMKKSGEQMVLELEKTDDILKYLGEHKKPRQFLCGFSMETENMVENSRAKLEKKNLDMIAATRLQPREKLQKKHFLRPFSRSTAENY